MRRCRPRDAVFGVDAPAAAAADGDAVRIPRRPLSATQLARRLGFGSPPTAEQAIVIEHLGVDGRPAPLLVVAGAGSGKTETMAARVVWLVANRLVRPERVLGLTFTRKAAGELAQRIRRRLVQLARSGLLADDSEDWLAGEPTVATYHSYAAGLFTEHALRIGREPSVRLLREAVAWQYAGRVVGSYAGDMSALDWAPATVIGAVRTLAADLSEHLGSAADLCRVTDEFRQQVEVLPPGPGQRTRGLCYAETEAFLGVLRKRRALLPLVEAYEERKRRTDALDYGDQVALAARIATEHEAVGRTERKRYEVVLLDEYQDTGTAQRVLLTALFGGGHPVTAVGDPCQSIYGWRGATAGNLRRFVTDFPDRSGHPCDRLALTTSFRNGGRILAVANGLSRELRRGGVPVSDLHPGPRGEDSGHVVHTCHEDAAAEAAWIADYVRDLLAPPGGRARYSAHQVAVLARTRAQFQRIEHALRAVGLPVEVSGLGGLLATPEVGDVVATLAVLSDPAAGAALLRLLTGARWRLGLRDLDALARRARQLADVGGDTPAEEPTDRGSIVEALDDPGSSQDYSPSGWGRISRLREELRQLRRRCDQPLPDLVADIISTTGLDIEVACRPGHEPASARGHLDRFLDAAAEFADVEEAPTIPSFLAYLQAAAEHERGLDTGRVGVPRDAVQLLTVHGAKGLEWPVVIVPGLTREVFPARPRESTDWCANAKVLPFPLRGDADDLPVLDLRRCADQMAVRTAVLEHKEACQARHALEERRLLYVAATRAEDVLVCSGYWWDHTRTPRGPSEFLTEIRDACAELGIGTDAGWAPAPPEGAANPLEAPAREWRWPADPLPGPRRNALQEGVALVRAAALRLTSAAASPAVHATADGAATATDPVDTATAAATADTVARWAEDVDRLLVERARKSDHEDEVELPEHLSVSQLVALRASPQELARWLRRPVPLQPAPLARRGTAFHAWLEQRFSGGRLLDLDELPGSADAGAASDEELARLKARFLASEWADRQPVSGGVEVPFETLVAGVLIRGRMDAVFRADDGTWDIVDWKTGRPPAGPDAAAAAVQLAAYRLAWHRLTAEPLERIRAGFCYVSAERTVRPVDLLDERGLAALVDSVPFTDRPDSPGRRAAT